MNTSASPVHTRHRGFDLLRVIAIYMVMQIHTGEFEYIGNAGAVLHTAGSWAVGWTNSLFRVCVPLFVMITGFFLFPIENERKFFRKRFTRVLIPFWNMPMRLTSSCVPAMPTQLSATAGPRMEDTVSSAKATVHRFAATAEPEPELEAFGWRVVS